MRVHPHCGPDLDKGSSNYVTAGSTAATANGSSVYTIAEGDTIVTIALEYNLDWQELLELNGLQPDSLIQIGQEIRLR